MTYKRANTIVLLSSFWINFETIEKYHFLSRTFCPVCIIEVGHTDILSDYVRLPMQIKNPALYIIIFRLIILNSILGSALPVKLLSGQYHITLLISNENWILVFTRGQFWPSGIVVACVCVCVCVRQSWACPSDNSSTVQARITKFGPEKQNTLVKIPIVFWGNWPWPSRSNLTSNSILTPFWACPNHYLHAILVRISKLGQEMHFSTVKIPVNSGLDWPWTSPSFLIPKLIFLLCGGVHWDCETVFGLFQFCSGTGSKSLHHVHQCTWGTHSQSGMGPLVLECLIWIKQNRHLDCFTVWLFHNTTMLCHILISVAEGI